MAHKVFLILAIVLLIGQLVEQTAADDGAMLSELADNSGGPDDGVYYEAGSRMRRGARKEKMKAAFEKAKPGLKKAAKVAGKVALGALAMAG